MNKSEMIQALKHRFPGNNPVSWKRNNKKVLYSWMQEYAITTEQERKEGVISVKVFGRWYKMFPKGNGAYPYECERQEQYPDAMVYTSEEGGWLTLHDYVECEFASGYWEMKEKV